jgi:nucleotide-binding universal stress UspA family protein
VGVVSTTVVILAVVWPVVGLLAGLLMARRGYDPLWVLIALPLGPLFVPIALERIRRRPGVAAFGSTGEPPDRISAVAGPRVLVGLDGSEQSSRALDRVIDLFGPRCGLLVLAEVIPFDATEAGTRDSIDEAARRLAEVAAGVTISGGVHTEVLTGPAGPALRRLAEDQDMDLLVVGRRGRGMSVRMLGSVSADLVERSPVAVLVIEPTAQRFEPDPTTGAAEPQGR